ncbi:MAG: transcriptional regulator, LuxR family [Frankiales bacterium]|nr:transcriptional regulator, LuxR family [Frankiales bacterium]
MDSVPDDEGVGPRDLLGLAGPAAAVYRALLRRPGTDVGALAALVGVSQDAVQDGLAELAGRGLVDGLVPVRPDTVLEPALVAVEREIATSRTAVTAARRELGELVELYAGGVARSDRTVEVERIDSSLEAVQRRIDELVMSMSSELLAINPSYTPEHLIEEEAEQSRALLARGVRLRTLLGPRVRDHPARLEHARAMDAAGDEHRLHPDPPLRLLLLDRRVAVVPVDPQNSADGALFVWSTTLVGSFLTLYESLWAQAEPLFRPPPGDGLAPREARLLELLAAGLKDETVARHLGVSVRTVRRESAALLDRLGAGTRFQAGVEAARRGWL